MSGFTRNELILISTILQVKSQQVLQLIEDGKTNPGFIDMDTNYAQRLHALSVKADRYSDRAL